MRKLLTTIGALAASLLTMECLAAGALAVDERQGDQWGWAIDYDTQAEADAHALRQCGQGCAIVARFNNTCMAFAADQARGSTAYGHGRAHTSGLAQTNALRFCRQHGGTNSTCVVRAWGCDTVEESVDTFGARQVVETKQDGAGPHGALAIDSNQGDQWGWAAGYPSMEAARQRARDECGQGCGVVMEFTNACAAYAADQQRGSTAYGWAYADTRDQARSVALGECRKRGGAGNQCMVRVWGCSVGEAAVPVARRPGEVFRDCPDCPEMVVIPAGSFRMGCVSGRGCLDSEKPVHAVRIDAPFALGRHEVTFAQWDACVSGGGCRGYRPADQGWGRGDRPVINVSWEDARGYASWLSRETGQAYRLPSEAEWEYAARAGTTTSYWWGNEIGSNRANCYGCGSRWDGDRTAPVGSFATSPWGLHDMHGNVWEWVEDCWNGSYPGAPVDGGAWLSGDCSSRVLRGGFWYDVPGLLRAAFRDWYTSGDRSYSVGFRVARTLAP